MKYIKSFENQQNENWRQFKAYLMLPQIIIEKILSKLIKLVPYLNIKYDELAAKIDFDRAFEPYIVKNEPKKLTLNDIENITLRNSLKVTGLFNNWNVYFLRTTKDLSSSVEKDKNVLYISKEEMKKGDKYFGERLSVDNDNQMYIMFAIKSHRHDDMRKERDIAYNKKENKELEKAVNAAIKENRYKRSRSFTGEWNNDPILFKVVRANRLDLFNKIMNVVSKDEAKELISMKINSDGWEDNYYGKSILKDSKSEEMTNSINSILYTPEELEEMEFKNNLTKFNL